jgi:hypothetical protein
MTQELFTEIGAIIGVIASVATAVGVFLAFRQLRHTKQQAVTSFEDTIAGEYRALTTCIPTKALLGKPLSDVEHEGALDKFYRYIDLSNEQIFLRQRGRISSETWRFWRDGIKSNLCRPAFKRAWDEISQQAGGDFSELRRLVESDYKDDPKQWP